MNFTAKERDTETGLDYFGARYYSSIQGRFTSPDPMMASAYPTRPQSWNRYSYTLNNPLRYVDPDGLEPQDPQGVLDSIQRYWEALSRRFWDSVHPEQAHEEGQRSTSPIMASEEMVVEQHAQAMARGTEQVWNAVSLADITGAGTIFKGAMAGNRKEVALGATSMAALPLSEAFNVGKGAITSGELLAGQVGKAEVLAQFSKEGNTLIAGIAALYNKAGATSV